MTTTLNPELQIRLKILKRFLPLLVLSPYTRAVFLAGSTARGNPQPQSDIDLVIVSQHGRLWLNRLFLELVVFGAGCRRSRKKTKNRLCFNMFLSNHHPTLIHQDKTGAECYQHLQPVSGSEREINNFWAHNLWLEKFSDLEPVCSKILGEPKKVFLWAQKTAEKILDSTGLGHILEKASYHAQCLYLEHAFKKSSANPNPADYDFIVKPDLIAYHFPTSNYALALKKARRKSGNPAAVENTSLKVFP